MMKITNSINLNQVIATTISKTLEFVGATKSHEEVREFCINLTKDKDFIKACEEMVADATIEE